MMEYQIQLKNFTGPLDLLLFFIRRDEIDIMDIPISQITDEYLSHLATLQTVNVGIAGEFIMMAATLMRIKAKMLLPQISIGDDGEDLEDPRAELVQRLLEYQRYKETAENLFQMIKSQSQKFPRPENLEYQNLEEDPSVYLEEVSLFELASLFKELVNKIPPAVTYDVSREQIKVKEKMAFLLTQFVVQKEYMFSELFPDFATRQELIATFIAILELIHDGQLHVYQKRPFGDFHLERISTKPQPNVGSSQISTSETVGEA